MCQIADRDYPSSLDVRKIYPIVEPHPNDPHGYIRIIDESGEDYLYSESRFSPIKLFAKIQKQVRESFLSRNICN